MSYTDVWFTGRAIPTKRRLDYLCHGKDGMTTGFLYACFRNEFPFFNLGDLCIFSLETINSIKTKKMEAVNRMADKCGLPPIFTDMNDIMKSIAEHDYYWGLRTQEQFVAEEAFARAGLSDFAPLDSSKFEPGFGSSESVIEKKIDGFDINNFDRETKTYWTGEKIDGVNQGEGFLYFKNGDIYEGTLRDGKFHGKGVLIKGSPNLYSLKDEFFWSGEWKDGKPWTGKGSYVESETEFCGVPIPAVAVSGTVENGVLIKGDILKLEVAIRNNETYVSKKYTKVGE